MTPSLVTASPLLTSLGGRLQRAADNTQIGAERDCNRGELEDQRAGWTWSALESTGYASAAAGGWPRPE